MSPPAIQADGIYTSAQIQKNLGISDVTLAQWTEFNGLQAYTPGTSKKLFFGSDVMEFIRSHQTGIFKPNAKEKAEFRRRK